MTLSTIELMMMMVVVTMVRRWCDRVAKAMPWIQRGFVAKRPQMTFAWNNNWYSAVPHHDDQSSSYDISREQQFPTTYPLFLSRITQDFIIHMVLLTKISQEWAKIYHSSIKNCLKCPTFVSPLKNISSNDADVQSSGSRWAQLPSLL